LLCCPLFGIEGHIVGPIANRACYCIYAGWDTVILHPGVWMEDDSWFTFTIAKIFLIVGLLGIGKYANSMENQMGYNLASQEDNEGTNEAI
jgi:hypothetical protein